VAASAIAGVLLAIAVAIYAILRPKEIANS
jgi:hypothetical protein